MILKLLVTQPAQSGSHSIQSTLAGSAVVYWRSADSPGWLCCFITADRKQEGSSQLQGQRLAYSMRGKVDKNLVSRKEAWRVAVVIVQKGREVEKRKY